MDAMTERRNVLVPVDDFDCILENFRTRDAFKQMTIEHKMKQLRDEPEKCVWEVHDHGESEIQCLKDSGDEKCNMALDPIRCPEIKYCLFCQKPIEVRG